MPLNEPAPGKKKSQIQVQCVSKEKSNSGTVCIKSDALARNIIYEVRTM